ncbi:hypothetical protein ACFFJN_05545 [Erwinia mallotivora]|uniref:hypothetical protein n=1 Tax=Erwinia mallotivora TaxID=69222 RepID=UPI0035E73D12
MKKLAKRDERFARLMAEAKEAPGFSYAKSRDREYKDFNDDYQADRLRKDADIAEAISTFKQHIIARDILSRQEALVELTKIFRAPSEPEIFLELMKLEKLRLEPEVYAARLNELNLAGVKNIKRTRSGISVEGYDDGHLAHRILTMAGVDVTRPITDEGKRAARRLLTDIFSEMRGSV